MDNFKKINDGYGHAVGDLALKCIALQLFNNMRTGDIVSRLGGDEFIAIAGFDDFTGVIKKHEELRQLFESVIFFNGNEIYKVSASVGCATFEVLPADIDQIISKSDSSMYSEKSRRKSAQNTLITPSDV